MSSRDLSAPGPKKSKMESKKSLFFNYFDSFSTPFSTFWAPGAAERPRELIFRLFVQLWAQRAQMTPVAGPGNPKSKKKYLKNGKNAEKKQKKKKRSKFQGEAFRAVP